MQHHDGGQRGYAMSSDTVKVGHDPALVWADDRGEPPWAE